jgi:oligopeptide/dipeptide ABC transporter ATP-binding protein
VTDLLEVENLRVSYRTSRGSIQAVHDVSFHIRAGETFGLVGESGCGKSSLGRAVIRLLDPESGSIRLNGVDLASLSGRRLKPYRALVQMVFQDPFSSLDPRHHIGRLIGEPISVGHDQRGKAERVRELLVIVGLRPELIDRLPHELSGGQRQRVAIARALAVSPELVICDEPVSALDVSLQAQILNLLADLQRAKNIAYLFISHDLGVVRYIAHRAAVMYLGELVEVATGDELWLKAAHPYTQALIEAVPHLDPHNHRISDKHILAGDLANPARPPSGCRFHTRCPHVMPRCSVEHPELREVAPEHFVACHLYTGGNSQ